jgi:hypothetical protein
VGLPDSPPEACPAHTIPRLFTKQQAAETLGISRATMDIATKMIYVHHVPPDDAADKLTTVVARAESPLSAAVVAELAAPRLDTFAHGNGRDEECGSGISPPPSERGVQSESDEERH